MDEIIQQVCRQEGKSPRELFLMMAIKHPAKFTNPEEVAAEWKQRLALGESIPYVQRYLRLASGTFS